MHIGDAAETLRLTRTQAAKMLSKWVSQGWLRRIGPGVYVPVPIEMLDNPHVVEKDYALGWELVGIYAHNELCENRVFKGGTCLKKTPRPNWW